MAKTLLREANIISVGAASYLYRFFNNPILVIVVN